MESSLIINESSDVYGLNNLVYKDEAFDIISSCFEVHKIPGRGFLEAVYKDALVEEFKSRNIPFIREQKYEILYKGVTLPHYYYADFIVYDKIVLEIKAQHDVVDQNYKQVINYLAVSKMKLGLLVNFCEPSLKFKRTVL